MAETNGTSMYEWIGGEQTIRNLVKAFYPKVQANPSIGPLFPEDVTPVMEKQFMFLSQFFGGPSLYTEAYGHPMMRARHMPFEITPERADAWLGCMKEALAEVGLDAEQQGAVLQRLQGPAYHFINSHAERE